MGCRASPASASLALDCLGPRILDQLRFPSDQARNERRSCREQQKIEHEIAINERGAEAVENRDGAVMPKTDEYRARAIECEEKAARSQEPDVKETFLIAARTWREVAKLLAEPNK